MSAPFSYDEEDEPGLFQRYRLVIGLAVVVLIGGSLALAVHYLAGKPSRPKPPEEIAIHLLPPPPTPPPPPPPPPPKIPPPPVQKLVEATPPKPNEAKPKNEPKSPDKPPGPPGPPASGPPSEFGLGGNGGGGDGSGDGGGGGSKYGYYANEVVSKITDALHRNDTTREASAHVKVRIWVDGSGRVTRARLANSSDDPAVDAAIQNQVLDGLTLPEPPPSDMPMPIVLVLNEVRPN